MFMSRSFPKETFLKLSKLLSDIFQGLIGYVIAMSITLMYFRLLFFILVVSGNIS